jgi:hypothetical protein
MSEIELLELLERLIGLEIAMSRRQIRAGRADFHAAVAIVGKALDRVRGRRRRS